MIITIIGVVVVCILVGQIIGVAIYLRAWWKGRKAQ